MCLVQPALGRGTSAALETHIEARGKSAVQRDDEMGIKKKVRYRSETGTVEQRLSTKPTAVQVCTLLSISPTCVHQNDTL